MEPSLPQPAKEIWCSQSAGEVLAEFDSEATGVSAAEVTNHLATNGLDELKEAKPIIPCAILPGRFNKLIVRSHHNAMLAKSLKIWSISLGNRLMFFAVATAPLVVLEARKVFLRQRTKHHS